MGAAIVLGDHLEVVVIPTAVRFLVLDADIGEMHLAVEVREVMVESPLADFVVSAVRVAVVVGTVTVALVQPLLVLTLELVVERDALDACASRLQALGVALVGAVNLKVV